MGIWTRIRDGVAELNWNGLFGLAETPGSPATGEGARSAATKQIGFTIAVIALGAKMAKADGVVTDDEVQAFHEVFQAPPEERAHVDSFFNLARRSTVGADTYARQVARLLDGQPAVLEDLLGALFHIAKADGRFDPSEEEYLRRIAQIFGFNETDWRRIRAFHLGSEGGSAIADDPWLILGLSPTAGRAAARQRWLHLVRDNHPDVAIAQGLPAEFVSIATAKLARINAAWDRIKASAPATPDPEAGSQAEDPE